MNLGRILALAVLAAGATASLRLQAQATEIKLVLDNATGGAPFFLVCPDLGTAKNDNRDVAIVDSADRALKADALEEGRRVALLPGHQYTVTYQLRKPSQNATDLAFYLADARARNKGPKGTLRFGEQFHMFLPQGTVEHLRNKLSVQRNVKATFTETLAGSESTIKFVRKAFDKIPDPGWEQLVSEYPKGGGPLLLAILKVEPYRSEFLEWAIAQADLSLSAENLEFLRDATRPGGLSMKDEVDLFETYLTSSPP